MPFELFDKSKLDIKPLSERISDINIDLIKDPNEDIDFIDDNKYT